MGQAMQPVEANVSMFDQMSDQEQKTMLAALDAIRAQDEERPELTN
jgi:hypothetical protein